MPANDRPNIEEMVNRIAQDLMVENISAIVARRIGEHGFMPANTVVYDDGMSKITCTPMWVENMRNS